MLPVDGFTLPAAQRSHSARPVDAAYEPVAHAAQEDARALLNLPSAQSTHVDAPSLLNVPAAHATQSSAELLPSAPFAVPAAHLVHDAECAASEYEPTAHGEHALEPAGEKEPAAHTPHSAAPAALAEPAGQTRQSSLVELPVCELAVPAAQTVHCVLASASA